MGQLLDVVYVVGIPVAAVGFIRVLARARMKYYPTMSFDATDGFFAVLIGCLAAILWPVILAAGVVAWFAFSGISLGSHDHDRTP